MTKDGKIFDQLPPVSRPHKSKINWTEAAEVARLTGSPVLAAKHVKHSLVQSVRQYSKPPFVTDEGRIIVNLRNSTVEKGVRYGDVFFTWQPNEPKESN
jgi:hypothetical protein